jgi:hypothetical protein
MPNLFILLSIVIITSSNMSSAESNKITITEMTEIERRREIVRQETPIQRAERLTGLLEIKIQDNDFPAALKAIKKLQETSLSEKESKQIGLYSVLERISGQTSSDVRDACKQYLDTFKKKRPPIEEVAEAASPSQATKRRHFSQTFTITLGDQAENHVGMQKIGELAAEGFDVDDLGRAKEWFESHGCATETVALHNYLPMEYQSRSTEAYVFVARKGLNALLGSEDGADHFFQEQHRLQKDKKALMYGRVVEKHARHNLCFGEEAQEPAYAEGKGRIVSFSSVPLLSRARDQLKDVMGSKAADLAAEGNYYYDLDKCGIGFHGDSERKKVVGVRIGAAFPLHFLWFKDSKPISEHIRFNFDHGDVYVFSEKATGWDWKRKVIPTLRHAAGASKYLRVVLK